MKKIIMLAIVLMCGYVNAGDFSLGASLGAVSVGNSWIKDDNQQTEMQGLSGIISLGADFEYFQDKDISVGGYLRYQGTGDDLTANAEVSFSNLALGVMGKGYLNSRNWSFYFGAGFGILSASYEVKTSTTTTKYSPGLSFGPMLVMGGLYPINERFWLGVENMRLIAFGEDLNGQISSDWVLKAKYDL